MVAALVAVVALPLSRPASALAVIEAAQAEFGDAPPFLAEVLTVVPAEVIRDERPEYAGPDAAVRRVVSYAGPDRWHREVISEDPAGTLDAGAGSYMVWDGETLGVYSADQHRFYVQPTAAGFDPLGMLSWSRPGNYWREVCADGESLAADEIAGRVAHHLGCGEVEVWIDAETGLILKLVAPQVSEEIVAIAYHPTFDGALFDLTPPAGATVGESEPQVPVIGDDPSWTAPLLGGGEISIDELTGVRGLVLVWADWCDRSCTDALASLETLTAGRTDVRAISVAIESSAENVAILVEEHDIGLPVAVDDGMVAEAWAVQTVPILVLLDEEGKVAEVHVGGDGIAAALERLAADN